MLYLVLSLSVALKLANAQEVNVVCPKNADSGFFNFTGEGVPFEALIDPSSNAPFSLGTEDNPLAQFDPYGMQYYLPSDCSTTAGVARADTGCPVALLHPAVLGVTNQVDMILYRPVMEHLAKYGMISLIIQSGEGATQDADEYPDQLENVLREIKSGDFIAEILSEHGVPGTFNPESLLLIGHGFGGRILLERLEDSECEDDLDLNIQGVVLIDPVEEPTVSVSLTGFDHIIDIDRRGKFSLVVPALHLQTELSALAAPSQGSECAPPDLSDDHFFNNWRGPVFYSRIGEVGFLDICNTQSQSATKDLCLSGSNVDAALGGFRSQCYQQAAAAHILHYYNLLQKGIGEEYRDASEFLRPKTPFDTAETLNGIEFFKRDANIELIAGTYDAAPIQSCVYDPDPIDPLTLLVLTIVGIGLAVAFVVITCCYYQGKSSIKAKDQELDEIIKNLPAEQVVSGMGYVKPNPIFEDHSPQRDAMSELPTYPPGLDNMSELPEPAPAPGFELGSVGMADMPPSVFPDQGTPAEDRLSMLGTQIANSKRFEVAASEFPAPADATKEDKGEPEPEF